MLKIFSIGLTGLVSSRIMPLKKCPDESELPFKPLMDFESSKYAGLRYPLMMDVDNADSYGGTIPDCVQYQITEVSGPEKTPGFAQYDSEVYYYDKEGVLTGMSLRSEVQKKGPAHCFDHFFGQAYPYMIVDTDYSTYQLVYSCVEIPGKEGPSEDMIFVQPFLMIYDRNSATEEKVAEFK